MPVQGRTRKQLRQGVGRNLGVIKTGTATGGTTETLIDTKTLRGGNDTYNGSFIVVTDADDGTTTDTPYIDDYIASSTTIAFQHALSFTVATGDTYEIWDDEYDPALINNLINDAIDDCAGRFYDPLEYPDETSSTSNTANIALFADGKSLRYDVPSTVSIINNLFYRSKVTSTSLHTCNVVFDESGTKTSSSNQNANIEVSIDTIDKKQGTGSNKFVYATGAGAGDVSTDSITSKDISKYNYLECWIKISGIGGATTAGNLKILLDNTANCASPLETLLVPVLNPDTWTYVRMELASPEKDTAIISIGLEYDADFGACQVRLDDIKVVQSDTAVWEVLPRHLWRTQKGSRQIILTDGGKSRAGYSMLKIEGGSKPSTLSADSDTCTVDSEYVINHASAHAFSSTSGGPGTDPDQRREQFVMYLAKAETAKSNWGFIVNGRVVE